MKTSDVSEKPIKATKVQDPPLGTLIRKSIAVHKDPEGVTESVNENGLGVSNKKAERRYNSIPEVQDGAA
jgi:hypothetical protein